MGAASRAYALTRGVVCAVAAVLLPVGAARGQIQPEARVEAVATGPRRVESGLGMSVRAGSYLRAGVNVAREVWSRGDSSSSSWRADYLVRFSMDPLGEQRWGVALGGGLGYRGRAYLLAVAELEGPRLSGVRPAAQLSLGGGVRVGLLLRRAADRRR